MSTPQRDAGPRPDPRSYRRVDVPPPRRDGSSRAAWVLVALVCAAIVVVPLALVGPVHVLAGASEIPPAEQSPLGATGQAPATFSAGADTPKGGAAASGSGSSVSGIPAGVLAAYRAAQSQLAQVDPGCHLDWSLVAGIGKVESGHARGGRIDAAGTTISPILGPRLDGTGANVAIRDTDDGALDNDTTWDRAVGPTQFIPSTWRTWGADGNGDGRTDPSNVYDASYATGRYLCAGATNLADSVAQWDAVFRYNHSASYVATVLSWARKYATGATVLPDQGDTAASASDILPPTTAPIEPSTAAAAAPAPVTASAAPPPASAAPAPSTPSTTSPPAATPPGLLGPELVDALFDSLRDGFSAHAGQVQTEDGSTPVYSTGDDGREVVTFALPAGGKRSEIVPDVATEREGQVRWVHYRAELHGVPADTDRWQLIMQWHQAGSSGSPPIALEVGRGHLLLANGGADEQSLGPIGPDDIVDVVLRVRFSADPSQSRIDVWRDGQYALAGYRPPRGTLFDGSDYLKFGLYRDPAIDAPSSTTVTDLAVADRADGALMP